MFEFETSQRLLALNWPGVRRGSRGDIQPACNNPSPRLKLDPPRGRMSSKTDLLKSTKSPPKEAPVSGRAGANWDWTGAWAFKGAVFVIVVMFAFACPIHGYAQQQSLETQQAIQMVRGLKDRRLFDLADQFANSQVNSERIPRNEKVSVLNELIRAKVVQAASLTGESRDQTWDRAHSLVADFINNNPDHPQILLLQVQDALTHYSHGNLISQEIAAEIQSAEQKPAAIEQFRNANRLLVKIEKEIEKELPIARSRTNSDGDLTVDQLINLKNNARYQLARINLARAELYNADDKLNRVDALQQVLSRLDELIRQTNTDVPLWWRAQTSRIQCLRQMNRIDQAIGVFKNLPDTELTEDLNSGLLTEQILIAAEKQISSDDLLEQVDGGASP